MLQCSVTVKRFTSLLHITTGGAWEGLFDSRLGGHGTVGGGTLRDRAGLRSVLNVRGKECEGMCAWFVVNRL